MIIVAENNNYVTAELGGGVDSRTSALNALRANAQINGPWEQFTEVPLSDGYVALKCPNGINVVTAENGGGSKVSTNRNQIGPWEKFKKINSLYQCIDGIHVLRIRTDLPNSPVYADGIMYGSTFRPLNSIKFPTRDELRSFKGNFGGISMELPDFGLGAPKNKLFTPAYVCYDTDTRTRIRQEYKKYGTHFPINVHNHSPIYRNWFPTWDQSKINLYLEELWIDNIYPVCSVLPDNNIYFNPDLDQDLVRIAFWWEDSTPIIRPSKDEGNKFWLVSQQYPNALVYWHNPPYQGAPYVNYSDWGLQPGDKSINGKVWSYIVNECGVVGLLNQGRCWCRGVDEPTIINFNVGIQESISNLNDFRPRLHEGGLGYPKADVIDFEENEYYNFTLDGDLSLGNNAAKYVRTHVPWLNGYCSG